MPDTRFSPPYAPPGTVLGIIRKWREHSLPEQVSTEWLTKNGIGLSSQPFIKRTLTFLGLTDAGSNTTEAARRLQTAASDQYLSVLEEIVRAAYVPILKVVNPSTASRTQIEDAFRGEEPQAQRPRMVALFVGLCQEAGIPLKEPPQGGRKVNGARNRVTLKVASKQPEAAAAPTPPPPTPVTTNRTLHPSLDYWIAEIPASGEEWTRSDFDSWLSIFSSMVERLYKIEPKT